MQILSGGDYFANLVQWFSFAGSVVVASQIARVLGAAPTLQAFAAVFRGRSAHGRLAVVYDSKRSRDKLLDWMFCLLCRADPRALRPI